MKKYFIVILYAVISQICFGQGMHTIKEDFAENKFNWDEVYTKQSKAFLGNGKLLLHNESNEGVVKSICNLPVIYDEDFKVKAVFEKPDINENDLNGIVFNFEDDQNFWVFLIREKEAVIGRFKDGHFVRVRTNPIILAKGKKKDVVVEMEKKGRNVIFSVDNMEVKTHPIQIVNNAFGFIKFNKGELLVSELEVSQYQR